MQLLMKSELVRDIVNKIYGERATAQDSPLSLITDFEIWLIERIEKFESEAARERDELKAELDFRKGALINISNERDELRQKMDDLKLIYESLIKVLNKEKDDLQSKLSSLLSQPARTWEECTNEVSKKYGYQNFIEWHNWTYHNSNVHPIFKEAAILFNSSTQAENERLKLEISKQRNPTVVEEIVAERDRLKIEQTDFIQKIETLKDLVKETDDLRDDNDHLKAELERVKEEKAKFELRIVELESRPTTTKQ